MRRTTLVLTELAIPASPGPTGPRGKPKTKVSPSNQVVAAMDCWLMHRCSHPDTLQAVPINAVKCVVQALMPVARNAGSLEAKDCR